MAAGSFSVLSVTRVATALVWRAIDGLMFESGCLNENTYHASTVLIPSLLPSSACIKLHRCNGSVRRQHRTLNKIDRRCFGLRHERNMPPQNLRLDLSALQENHI